MNRAPPLKKISKRQKIRRLRLLRRRMLRHKRGGHTDLIRRETFASAIRRLPVPACVKVGERWADVLEAPAVFSLAENFRETLGFIYRARTMMHPGHYRPQKKPWRLDFSAIKTLGPAAALVLAGELDRWAHLAGRPPRPLVETWHPEVQLMFHELGLLPLLGLPQYERPTGVGGTSLKFLPFRRGSLTRGEVAENLRKDLEGLSGLKVQSPRAIYVALCEAMTNALHHAYRYSDASWPAKYLKSWWATGAFDGSTGSLHFFVYDQGVGIPRTLPRSKWWDQVIALNWERNDANLIKAAIEVRRSSIPIAGRGRGLNEIVSFIDQEDRGRLRIVSGDGEVCFLPHKSEQKTLPGRLLGTLIEWQIDAPTA